LAKGNVMNELENMFNWDAAADAAGVNPFSEKRTYEKDERFYVLPKNEKKEGVAIIRLLPDAEGKKFTTMFKIGTTIEKNNQKRFVNEYSPASIGEKCPFQEKWAELYNSGDKEGAKLFSRSVRYVVNIKVIKDPVKPENEGKIFLYDISGSLKDKWQAALQPSDTEIQLGTKPKQLFNPLKGNSIKLVAKIGANGQTNYDSTEVMAEETAIYSTPEEAIADIKANTYTASKELQAPSCFKSYEWLEDKLRWVTFSDASSGSTPTAVASVTTSATPAPVASAQATPAPVTAPADSGNSDLDALLAGIM
jgi:hypothetical protein